MTPLIKVGLLLHCFEAMDHAEYDEKQASSILDLPQNSITEELLPVYMGALGNEIAKSAESFKETLVKSAASWYEGYTNRLSELGVDTGSLEKKAQEFGGYSYNFPAYAGLALRHYGANQLGDVVQQATGAPEDQKLVSDSYDYARKLFGEKVGPWAAGGLAMVPGVGTLMGAYDAGADFINMFGKGLDWKQRLGYGLSSLFNAGMTAADIFTAGVGGSVGRGLLRGAKALLGVGKGTKGLRAAAQGAKGMRGVLGRGMLGAAEGIQKGRAGTRRFLTDMARSEGAKGIAGRALMRGTTFGGAYGSHGRQAALDAAKEGKGFLGRAALQGKDLGKTVAGIGATNLPMMVGMTGAGMMINSGDQPTLPNVPEYGYPQLNYGLPDQYNYGSYSSGTNLGFNSVGKGYQNQVGGRFPQGQSM